MGLLLMNGNDDLLPGDYAIVREGVMWQGVIVLAASTAIARCGSGFDLGLVARSQRLCSVHSASPT